MSLINAGVGSHQSARLHIHPLKVDRRQHLHDLHYITQDDLRLRESLSVMALHLIITHPVAVTSHRHRDTRLCTRLYYRLSLYPP